MSTVTFDISRFAGSITTSSGVGEMSFPDGLACEILQIIVEPAISNNMYHVDVINVTDNMTVWDEDIDGKANYLKPFPVWGSYKIRITNATFDDVFKIVAIYR